MSRRIHISKGENRLRLFENGQVIRDYPVATGRDPSITPEGTFTIVMKIKNPSWTDPQTGVTIPGGAPNNPLGTRWLGLRVGDTYGNKYGIHGTNRPETIGQYVSAGCVRMYQQDVEELFELVPWGTQVTIQR